MAMGLDELRLEVEQAEDRVLRMQVNPNRNPDAMGKLMMALQSARLRLQDAENDCDCEFCRKENDLRLAIRLGGHMGNSWLEQAED